MGITRYETLSVCIRIMESIRKTMDDGGAGTEKMTDHIRNLQDITKDVRYGGHWDGSFEAVARGLDHCIEAGKNCETCPYSKMRNQKCIAMLKRDAASAIRQMSKTMEDLQNMAEEREPAEWQRRIMNGEKAAEDRFPWDGEEE